MGRGEKKQKKNHLRTSDQGAARCRNQSAVTGLLWEVLEPNRRMGEDQDVKEEEKTSVRWSVCACAGVGGMLHKNHRRSTIRFISRWFELNVPTAMLF